MHIDRYLHKNSHHLPTKKSSIINTLVTRGIRISDKGHIEKKFKHLNNVLRKNGYQDKKNRKAIQKSRSSKNPHTRQLNEEGNTKKIFPYFQGTTDKLVNILKKQNIKGTFYRLNTIGKMVDSTKYPATPKLCKGVYSIPCPCGKLYIDEMGRSIDVIMKEHWLT